MPPALLLTRKEAIWPVSLSSFSLLTLALAPATNAEPPNRGESLFAGWFDAFWGALDRIFSWIPTVRSEPRSHGAYIDPSGVVAPPQGGAGPQAAPQKHGAYIDPSGIRAVLPGRGKSGTAGGSRYPA